MLHFLLNSGALRLSLINVICYWSLEKCSSLFHYVHVHLPIRMPFLPGSRSVCLRVERLHGNTSLCSLSFWSQGKFSQLSLTQGFESFLTLWSTVFADVPFAASWRELLRAERHVPPELWLREGDGPAAKNLFRDLCWKNEHRMMMLQTLCLFANLCNLSQKIARLDRHPPDLLLFCVSHVLSLLGWHFLWNVDGNRPGISYA